MRTRKNNLLICILIILTTNLFGCHHSTNELSIEKKILDDHVEYSIPGVDVLSSVFNSEGAFFLTKAGKTGEYNTISYMKNGEEVLKNIYQASKKDVYIGQLIGNEKYISWREYSDERDYECLMVYSLKENEIIRKINITDEKRILGPQLDGDRIIWMARDSTKMFRYKGPVVMGDPQVFVMDGSGEADIVEYDILTDKEKVVDHLKFVNPDNALIAQSTNKIWYIDNNKFGENASVKSYDKRSGKVSEFPMQFQLLGHIKPINDHMVCFYHGTTDGTLPQKVSLFDVDTQETKVLTNSASDFKAKYDGTGGLYFRDVFYNIKSMSEIYQNKALAARHTDNGLMFSAGYGEDRFYFLNQEFDEENNMTSKIIDYGVKKDEWFTEKVTLP